MELRHLRYFIAVADSLNFSRAAESLFISQSALSQQIAELESEIGVDLFRRSKRSVELTQAGSALLDQAKDIISKTEKLIPFVRHENGRSFEKREISIGVEPRVIANPQFSRHLTDTVFEIRKEIPGLRALFKRMEFQVLEQSVMDKETDLGFFLNDEEKMNNKLAASVLDREEMVLVFRNTRKYADRLEATRDIILKRGLVLIEKDIKGMSQILRILDELDVQP